jgi:hypothetical protein
MKPKTVVTVVLLLFVGVSVGALVLKERRGESAAQSESKSALVKPGANPEISEGSVPAKEAEVSSETAESPAVSGPARQVVVYYFHGAKRCATCMKIEAYTREEVETSFADLLQDRAVELRIVNVDEAENEHFVQDYELSTRSVVVSLCENGQEKDWKVLEKVWQLVDAKPEFQRYIRTEVEEFLMKGSEPQ